MQNCSKLFFCKSMLIDMKFYLEETRQHNYKSTETYIKAFKPIDVKNANGSASASLAYFQRFVDLFN